MNQAPPGARAATVRAGQAAGQDNAPPFWRNALNGIAMVLVTQYAINYLFTGGANKANSTAPSFPTTSVTSSVPGEPVEHLRIPEKIFPLWPADTVVDVSVYLLENPWVKGLHTKAVINDARVFHAEKFNMGNTSDTRQHSTDIQFSPQVQHNGTLFALIVVAKQGAAIDPAQPGYNTNNVYRNYKVLTRYHPKKKVVKVKKLIGGKEEETAVEAEEPIHTGKKIVSYWHSNLTIHMVPNMGELVYNSISPPARQYVNLESTDARDETGRNGWYYPVAFTNDFWLLREHMVELNDTVKSLPMHISLSIIRPWQFTVYATMDESFKLQAQQNAGQASELDEIRRVLVETNVYLLGTTFVVSLLHMLFEMLAFKSDISHWRNKKDNVGISVRTILANVFMQIVIFLYLIDNSDGTSWMILFGQGMGIVLEAWKITKTVDVKIREAPGTLFGYKVAFEDKHKLSETEEKTKEYDEIAFRYLYVAAIPLLLAYAAYSVLYESHKGWYSFIISTLVGSVYAYGFLMMVPSLYINYRLKSVAHIPRKTMMYKFLNTFIDDLFAFTIKMPTLHRLATLRDDVIFFIFLYQSWVYRIDYSRVNEFGQGGAEESDTSEKPVPADANVAAAAKTKVDELTSDGTTAETAGEALAVSTGSAAKAKGGRKRK